MAGLEVLGEDFKEKYMEAQKKATQRLRRLEMTDEIKTEIIDTVRKNIKPDAPLTNYPRIVNGTQFVYHIVLATTGKEQVRVFDNRWGPSVFFNWNGVTLSASQLDSEQIGQLTPDTPYILIGKYRENRKGDRTFHNFYVHAILSMDDIAAHEAVSGQVESKDVTPEPTV